MVSQTVPGAADALSEANFRTTTAYDDLDRPTSKVIGERDLPIADQVLFATGTEQLTWDEGPNNLGRLRTWRTFAPGVSTPALTIDVDHNARGQRTRTAHALGIAGYQELSRELSRDYYISGAIRTTNYHDQIGGMNATSSRVTQDARGLPSSVVLSMTGQPDQIIAAQTRNVAGVPARAERGLIRDNVPGSARGTRA